MSAEAGLEAECHRLTRYLLDEPPSSYVVACYLRAHRVSPEFAPRTRLDQVALRLAATGMGARLADAHARLFAPTSALRRKLVLLLAILEVSSSSFRRVDDPGSTRWIWLRLAWIGVSAGVAALAGSVLLLPIQLLGRGR